MKDKIMYIIIGVLIGAIITAGGFLLFGKNSKGRGERPNGEPGQMQMDENFTPGNKAKENRVLPDENMTKQNSTLENEDINT